MRTLPTLACLALAALASCSIPTLDATPRYLQFEPAGDLEITNGPLNSGNSMEDLGLAEAEGTVGAHVALKWGMPHLSISTQNTSWTGQGTLRNEFSSGGVTIAANTQVDSELDLGLHSALLTWDFLPGSPELGIGFGVAGVELAGTFESNVPPFGLQRVEFDESVPVPMLAVRAALDVGPIEVLGSLSGLSAKVDDDEATIFDLDVAGRWHLIGMDQRGGGHLSVGWRQLEVDVEVTTDTERVEAGLSFSGPYVGVTFTF